VIAAVTASELVVVSQKKVGGTELTVKIAVAVAASAGLAMPYQASSAAVLKLADNKIITIKASTDLITVELLYKGQFQSILLL